MSLYAIGYNELTQERLVNLNHQDQTIRVNLNPFLAIADEHESVKSLRLFLTDLEQNSLKDEDVIVTSFEPINSDIRAALLRKKAFSLENYDRITKLLTIFVHYFHLKPFQKRAWAACSAPHFTQWESKLYARYGNVELRVIDSYLRNQARLEMESTEILRHLADENYMYQGVNGTHWLSSADANFNLRKLMTNAGFYMDENLATPDIDSVRFWATEYLSALTEAHFLFPYPGSYPNFFVPQDHLFKQQHLLKDYLHFPGTEKFYTLLEAQNILLMTPFYREIDELFNSKRLFNLYNDIVIPDFSLTTVPAYVSTYPNRPHASWSETFKQLRTEVDLAFAKNQFSIFFASCGCYGLPICRYVFNRYGCTSVYFGNHINTLFGVLQQCSEAFMPERRIGQNWSTGQLTQFKNVSKIDGGRYI